MTTQDEPATSPDDARSVLFVCHGNICRSPMAERMAEQAADVAGLEHLTFTSAGVSSEEAGNPIDPRAVQKLRELGCRTGDHRAHQITAEEARAADLIVCAEQRHADRVARLDPELAPRVKLFTDFVPGAEPASGVPDPWYGDESGFDDTADTIAAALPAILDWARSTHR